MDALPTRDQELLRQLGQALAAQRHACGLTQEALAQRLGISDKAVARWESGGRDMRVSSLVRLAEALDTSVDALLNYKAEPVARSRTARPTGPRQGLARTGWKPVPRGTPGAVPIYDLQARAGSARAKPTPNVLGWALPRQGHPREEGLFLARVSGESMAPKYRDGQWLLFATYKESALHIGEDVLVQSGLDSDLPGWVVKRVSAMREVAANRTELTLHSYNDNYPDQTAVLETGGDTVVSAVVKKRL